MKIYEYTLEFKEEVYFASKELGILFETNPVIGNYALNYAMKFCESKYNQTEISYMEDFEAVNNLGIYITPAFIEKPKYVTTMFNALSDTYNNKMERARFNFPQRGKIKSLSSGNIAKGFIFCNDDFKKQSYIRLGKFMGKVKVIYKECTFNIVKDFKKECFGYVNVVDLSDEFEPISYEMLNMHPAPLMKSLKGNGRLYQIKVEDKIYYYPVNFSLGGI